MYVYMKNPVSPEISNASVPNPKHFIFSETVRQCVYDVIAIHLYYNQKLYSKTKIEL